MDFEEIQSRLNAALPRDIQVWKVDFQKEKPLDITQADYRLTVYPQDPEKFWQDFSSFCAQPEILTQKRTKKGMKTVDLKPEFTLLSHEMQEETCILTPAHHRRAEKLQPHPAHRRLLGGLRADGVRSGVKDRGVCGREIV